jgi:hypothetical protein
MAVHRSHDSQALKGAILAGIIGEPPSAIVDG